MRSDKMLFVVGNSRSGTTMMGRILGNHSDVFTFGELHFFGQLWSPNLTSGLNETEAIELASKLFCIQRVGYRKQGDTRDFQVDAQEFCADFSDYPVSPTKLFSTFLQSETNLNDKSIPCDQTPRNVFYIDEILKVYPQAKIINMIRDPRDVLLSQKRKWQRRFLGGTDLPLIESLRDWINYHPLTISRIWHTAVNTADRFSKCDKVYTVYFEQLLSSPEKTVADLCRFVDIEYTPCMLQVPQVGSSVDSDKPTTTGINPNRAGNWNVNSTYESKLNSSEI
ncbi:sulfotransferase, partial [Candidatus Poribacteria bacterium]|nr:sulfotransferase [Candidatus Poribacteria bacterium]